MSFLENEQIILKELDTVLGKIDQEQIDQAMKLINESDKIFFNALGRAAFAGKSFVMRLMHMGREVYVVGETNTPNFGPNDLLIICSGSGETKQFIQIAEKAKSLGGKVMVFTGTPNSTLDKMSDASIIIQAPSKKQEDSDFTSVQPMASLFEQGILISGDAIILSLMENGTGNGEMFSRHSNLE
ncbi:MAG: 6-phospho-3-hexuloisomerase [Lachnospiraceae bacterium]